LPFTPSAEEGGTICFRDDQARTTANALPGPKTEPMTDDDIGIRRLVHRSPFLTAAARRMRAFEWSTRARMRRLTGHVPTVRVGDSTMKVPEDMYWAFAGGQYYERSVTHWIEQLLSLAAEPVFYDIGANYGYYTLLAAPTAGHVYSFEPVSTTLRQLRENVTRNNLDERVSVFPLGLSDHDGTIEINIYNSSGNNSLFPVTSSDSSVHIVRTEPIELVTLDGLVEREGLRPPTVVKMDIEGAELLALRGASSTLARSTPAIVMEFDDSSFVEGGYSRVEILAELDTLGYTVFGLSTDAHDFTLHAREHLDDHSIANVVAVPSRWTAAVLDAAGSGRA
jgi:FkbM family methyltransferase